MNTLRERVELLSRRVESGEGAIDRAALAQQLAIILEATAAEARDDLSHERWCLLSRQFNHHADLGDSRIVQINEFLKLQIARTRHD